MRLSKIHKTLLFILGAIVTGGLFGSFFIAAFGGVMFATVPALGALDYSSAIQEKREKLAELKKEMRTLIDTAEEEKRDFTDDEEKRFSQLEEQVNKLKKAIERLEKAERSLSNDAERKVQNIKKDTKEERQQKLDAAFRSYLRKGLGGLTTEERDLLEEHRALNTSAGSEGGYTVPTGFANKIDEAMKEFGGIINVAEVLDTSTGEKIQYPTVNDTSNKGAILEENTSAGNSTDPAFGSVTLNAFTYSSKPVLISNQLLQDNAVNLDAILTNMLVTRVMRAFSEHAAVGTGTNQPQGITVGGTKGADAASTVLTYDDLVDLLHSVDSSYRKNGVFMFNDNTLRVLKKLKDAQQRPLFLESMRAGEPETILGKPYVINNDMPDIGPGNKSIAFGDFKKYIVRRVTGYSVKRLVERYADFNQTGFLLFVRMDGRVIDAGTHPIKYIQHATA